MNDRHHSCAQEQPHNGITIRVMQQSNLPDALRLTEMIGWNQLEADWRLFLQENPEGCFVAVHNGRVAGTTTSIQYGPNLAWVSMVLVDPSCRRMGIGRRLLEHALANLKEYAVVKLDATPAGRELYEKLGFKAEYSLRRWIHDSLPRLDAPEDTRVQVISPDTIGEIAHLDEQVFGAPRKALLETLATNDQSRAYFIKQNKKISGFCLARSGRNFHQVGPVAAENFLDAVLLAQSALASLEGRAVVLDVPDSQTEFTAWLQELGFVEQRPFLRMARSLAAIESGTKEPQQQFAICGPEFG